MKFIATKIPGCFEILPDIHEDQRGLFIKTFHEETFVRQGLNGNFQEDFYTVSRKGVLRGLHFHLPPRDHDKLVLCVSGSIFDVAVDLRQGSPAFGRHVGFELSARKRNMIYIPRGLAHGFCATSPGALVYYKTTTVYSPVHDSGVRWDSARIRWPVKNPIVSSRDRQMIPMSEFKTPFIFQG